MIARLCLYIIISVITTGLLALVFPFVMAGLEWVWDSWRNRT